jgi:hypothetical protein
MRNPTTGLASLYRGVTLECRRQAFKCGALAREITWSSTNAIFDDWHQKSVDWIVLAAPRHFGEPRRFQDCAISQAAAALPGFPGMLYKSLRPLQKRQTIGAQTVHRLSTYKGPL